MMISQCHCHTKCHIIVIICVMYCVSLLYQWSQIVYHHYTLCHGLCIIVIPHVMDSVSLLYHVSLL